jgi:hypothetical protein
MSNRLNLQYLNLPKVEKINILVNEDLNLLQISSSSSDVVKEIGQVIESVPSDDQLKCKPSNKLLNKLL